MEENPFPPFYFCFASFIVFKLGEIISSFAFGIEPGDISGMFVADIGNIIMGVFYFCGFAQLDTAFYLFPRFFVFHIFVLHSIFWIMGGNHPHPVIKGGSALIYISMWILIWVALHKYNQLRGNRDGYEFFFWRICYVIFTSFHGITDLIFSLIEWNLAGMFLHILRNLFRLRLIYFGGHWLFPVKDLFQTGRRFRRPYRYQQRIFGTWVDNLFE